MYSKIILNNWRSHPGKLLIMFSALSIGLVIITLLSSLNTGLRHFFLKEGQKDRILRELHVTAKGTKLDLSLFSLIPEPKLTPTIIDEIKALPEVADVLPTNTISGISSLQIGLLGQWFQTDALLFGAPYELLDTPEIDPAIWTPGNEPFPAVVSTQLIDLYNFTFANANNLPQLTEQNFIGTEITILLNKSTFFASEIAPEIALRAKIVGFSPHTKLLGLTLPQETINDINSVYLKRPNQNFLDAIVHVKKPENLTSTQNKLQQMGLTAVTAESSLQTLESIFSITNLTLNLFFILMMLLSGLLISTTFLAKIAEKSREIAILKTLGFTSLNVATLYLLEALLMGLAAAIVAPLVAFIISLPLEALLSNLVANLLNHPQQFFLFTWENLLWLGTFTVFIACAFAFLPARKAAQLDPIAIFAK